MEEMDEFVGKEGQRGRSWGKGDVTTSSRVKRMQNASNALHCNKNSMPQHSIKGRN
jgi:hypothetical protein